MRWHAEERNDDGNLRHPADSDAWKDFDNKHAEYALEPRNVRLGLATDGFNPFGNMNINYSTWPVLLMVYNLPPGLCMQRPYMLMSLLIEGPTGPKQNIDVYLQPLIEELNLLWGTGISTWDASAKQHFRMRANLMWTINDFPAYSIMSGWSTSGILACPNCAENTVSEYLHKSKKVCYMGHERFRENPPPPPPSGFDVLSSVGDINVTFGSKYKPPNGTQWRKKSIFFELPYWTDNLIRHNLDVMHIEKNVGELLLKWLDAQRDQAHENAKEDIKMINRPPTSSALRGPRHPDYVPKTHKYPQISSVQRKMMCDVLSGVKVPSGYSSNIARCFSSDRNSGLKSHDYHVLMQQLLPVAIRNIGLPKQMADAIIELCDFFRGLCSKSNRKSDFQKLHTEIGPILCKLESKFPHAFFVVMIHLTVHLAQEATVGGCVHYRYMYPIERCVHQT